MFARRPSNCKITNRLASYLLWLDDTSSLCPLSEGLPLGLKTTESWMKREKRYVSLQFTYYLLAVVHTPSIPCLLICCVGRWQS